MDNGGGGGEKSGDFYSVLGLKKECSDAELRNAYKKLAMRWHPDRCSASGNSKFVEEAKGKFQEIQEAYSVLSDSNKRFLYDVGVYDSHDDENGMGDFLGEMAQMMSQTKPSDNGHESFEELQQLFVDMFQSDLDGGFGGPSSSYKTSGYDQFSASSSSSSSSSCNGNIGSHKRNNSAMNSVKTSTGEFESDSGTFCFGLIKEALTAHGLGSFFSRFMKANSTAGFVEFFQFSFTPSLSNDSASSTKRRGSSSSSKIRNGRKQKVSSKHDVPSRDAEISAA